MLMSIGKVDWPSRLIVVEWLMSIGEADWLS